MSSNTIYQRVYIGKYEGLCFMSNTCIYILCSIYDVAISAMCGLVNAIAFEEFTFQNTKLFPVGFADVVARCSPNGKDKKILWNNQIQPFINAIHADCVHTRSCAVSYILVTPPAVYDVST